jgi:hypothetical protein
MSEKPNYRHSFLNPERTEKDKLVVNRFGHTILGGQLEDNVLPHKEMDVSVDPAGDIVATRKAEIFEHPAVKRWAINAGIDPSVFTEEETLVPDADAPEDIAEAPIVEIPRSLFDHLPTSLDELARESKILSADNPMDGFPAAPRLNRSSPQEVQITLPANLGSTRPAPQAPAPKPSMPAQHCSGCQGSHPANARFCPHCGMALSRFCIHCGYQFAGSEKFCPDCGERR